jgi:hypothetical protein
MEKLSKHIYSEQKKYNKLRNAAHDQLVILEEYFGRNSSNKEFIYQQILLHLYSSQKEISYFGLRGVIVGVIATIFTFGFNSMIVPELIKLIEINKIAGLFSTTLISIIFFLLFLYMVREPFILDRNRRNQLYINEYMIELVKEKIKKT